MNFLDFLRSYSFMAGPLQGGATGRSPGRLWQLASASTSAGWLGLAGFGWLAPQDFGWIWLDSRAGSGLVSAGFGFWLSFTRLWVGFGLIWFDFVWIWRLISAGFGLISVGFGLASSGFRMDLYFPLLLPGFLKIKGNL